MLCMCKYAFLVYRFHYKENKCQKWLHTWVYVFTFDIWCALAGALLCRAFHLTLSKADETLRSWQGLWVWSVFGDFHHVMTDLKFHGVMPKKKQTWLISQALGSLLPCVTSQLWCCNGVKWSLWCHRQRCIEGQSKDEPWERDTQSANVILSTHLTLRWWCKGQVRPNGPLTWGATGAGLQCHL